MRTVSLGSLNANFNQVFKIDHFFLDHITVCHVMDTLSRYSVGQIVTPTAMSETVNIFESRCISEFWPPDEVQYDRAPASQEFENFLDTYAVKKRRIPPRRHNKLALESKKRSFETII